MCYQLTDQPTNQLLIQPTNGPSKCRIKSRIISRQLATPSHTPPFLPKAAMQNHDQKKIIQKICVWFRRHGKEEDKIGKAVAQSSRANSLDNSSPRGS